MNLLCRSLKFECKCRWNTWGQYYHCTYMFFGTTFQEAFVVPWYKQYTIGISGAPRIAKDSKKTQRSVYWFYWFYWFPAQRAWRYVFALPERCHNLTAPVRLIWSRHGDGENTKYTKYNRGCVRPQKILKDHGNARLCQRRKPPRWTAPWCALHTQIPSVSSIKWQKHHDHLLQQTSEMVGVTW